MQEHNRHDLSIPDANHAGQAQFSQDHVDLGWHSREHKSASDRVYAYETVRTLR